MLAHPSRELAAEEILLEARFFFGADAVLERESIGPTDEGLIRRRLGADKLADSIGDVTKLGAGVVPDQIPETRAGIVRFGEQHFLDCK